MAGTRVAIDENVAKFLPIDGSNVYVLGTNGALWWESAPFGNVPPGRFEIANNVKAWKPVSPTGQLLALKTDSTLWLYPKPTNTILHLEPIQVDGNVKDFYPLDGDTVFVLGLDGHLWQEMSPFGKVPPKRVIVDVGVQAFTPYYGDTWDTAHMGVLALGSSAFKFPLVIDLPPFGKLPPSNSTLVDENVAQFYQSDVNTIWVLGTNGNLWIEKAPFGTPPPARQQVDGNVKTFRGPNGDYSAYVLGTDGKLWLEFPYTGYDRVLIDSNIESMDSVGGSEYQVYVLDSSSRLSEVTKSAFLNPLASGSPKCLYSRKCLVFEGRRTLANVLNSI